MPTANEMIVVSLTTAKMMARRFTEDFQPGEYLHRPAAKANCAAWLLGHLTLTNRRTASLFHADLPALPDGFEQRFARDETAPGASEFGDCGSLLPLLEQSFDALIAVVRTASPEQLDTAVARPTPMYKTLGTLANFMALHALVHIGQITTIRRSLGRPPLI
ncbi:hypothetical protein BH09PLA1_BH09PLA1_27080 [soil metagenome]